MSLRNRALFTVAGSLMLLVIVLIVVAQVILLDGFEQLEHESAVKNVDRVINTFNDEITTLLGSNADWAHWTDTYEFIQDANESYVEDNLSNETLSNLNVNMMIFIKNDGTIVFSKAFDLSAFEEIPLPEGLESYLMPDSPLINHADESSTVGGVVLLDGIPTILTSRPILTNEIQGPIHGSLIFGRFINEERLQELSDSLKLDISIIALAASLSADEANARDELGQSSSFVQAMDNQTLVGYGQLNDINDNPALLVKVMLNRDILAQGQATFSFFAISLVALAIGGGLLTAFLLDRSILSRVTKLQHEVSQISTSGDLSYRIPVEGQDELSSLGTKLNEMLGALASAQQAQKEIDERLRAVVNNAPLLLWAASPDGVLQLIDGAELQNLDKDKLNLVGKNLADWIEHVPMTTDDFAQTVKGIASSARANVGDLLFTSQYVPLKDAQGTVTRVIGVATNITVQVTAEENLDHKNRELARAHELLRSSVEQLNETFQRGATLDELRDSVLFIQKEFEKLQN